jgi:hypothetical protein
VVYDGPTRELTPERLRALYGAQTDELLQPQAPAEADRPPLLSQPILHAA